jgi:hypothetical protein
VAKRSEPSIPPHISEYLEDAMNLDGLNKVARAMVAPGKGILAADESSPTIKKRFDSIALESTEEHRRSYREMLFTTEGSGEYISGVILYDETLRQACADGTSFAEYLAARRILPGIKVDAGAKALAGFPGEKITEGLDGLRERLAEYRGLGAKFAKWRAVIDIADGIPTDYCIRANAQALARYAALCQAGGIVPIVEPEVLMDGDHDLARCEAVTGEVLSGGVPRTASPPGGAGGHGAQAQHGRLGQEVPAAGRCRRSGRGHGALPEASMCPPPCRASHSCPVARATRRQRPSQRHERSATPPWDCHVLLRPRPAGFRH